MKLTIELFVLGAVQGSLYALGSLGMIVVYRSSGVLNLAHSAIGVTGMFLFAELRGTHEWPLIPAAAVGVLIAAALGYLTYLGAVRAIAKGSALVRVIGTLAVLLILYSGLQLRYGQLTLPAASYLPQRRVSLVAGATVGVDRLILLAIACALTIALGVLYRRTKFGLATTAVAENNEALAALGWSVGRLSALNWSIGGALSGLSLILLAPIVGVNVAVVFSFLLPVLSAAMAGDMSSFGLALLGGVTIGVLQTQIGAHSGTLVSLPDAVPFIAIVVLLTVRGRGLPLRSFIGDRLPRIGTGRLRPGWIGGVAVAFVFVANLASRDWLRALTVSLTTSILVLSLVVVVGLCGQLSLAQASLAGCAAMAASKLVADHDAPFALAMLIGVATSAVIGVAVGIPALRTRGVTLGVATLALGVAIDALVFQNPRLNTGFGIDVTRSGTRSFTLFGIDLDPVAHPMRYLLLVASTLLVLLVVVINVRRGRAGRRFIAIRNNERGAAALGMDTRKVKLWAFAYGGVIAGIAGVLMVFMNSTVTFQGFSPVSGLNTVSFAVVGGVGSAVGALFGGALASGGVGTQLLNAVSGGWADYIFLVGGIVLLLTVIGNPDGQAIVVSDTYQRIAGRARRRAASTSVPAPAPNDGSRASSGRLEAVQPRHLEVRGVTVRFGGVVALNDVSFDVAPGEALAVIGPNGAGKTTLVDALTGFVTVSRGAVSLDGRDVTRWMPHRRSRAGLGRSFQSLELFEDLSVGENLLVAEDDQSVGAYVRDLVRPIRKPTSGDVELILAILGLTEAREELPSSLSYGQRRLLAVGRAVVGRPSVLFLDEPCAGLDSHERDEVGTLIRRLIEQTGMSVVLVEHDVDLVRRVADRVIALDFGVTVASGTPEQVFRDPRVVAAYLGADDVPASQLVEAAGGGA